MKGGKKDDPAPQGMVLPVRYVIVFEGGPGTTSFEAKYRGMRILIDAGIPPNGTQDFGWEVSVPEHDADRARTLLQADANCRPFVVAGSAANPSTDAK